MENYVKNTLGGATNRGYLTLKIENYEVSIFLQSGELVLDFLY